MVVVVEEVCDEVVEEVVFQEGENEFDFEIDFEVFFIILDDDDFNFVDEFFYDWFIVFKDIVFFQICLGFYNKYKLIIGWVWWGIQSVGFFVWLVSISVFLVGLFLVFVIEDEVRVVVQEKEMQMQSVGQQQVSLVFFGMCYRLRCYC